MDTSRIIINTINNSNYSTETSTAVAGYTVIKAPKGWNRPKKISAGGTAKLKDIFGVSSAKYPELFEVETFNKSYDVYVSAPYGEGTSVPIAYVTKDGVFVGKNTIPYTSSLEDVISGGKEFEEDTSLSSSILGNNQEIQVLVDTKYAGTCGLGGEDVSDNIVFNSFKNITDSTSVSEEGVAINLGMTKIPQKLSSFVIKGIKYTGNFTISPQGDIKYNNVIVGNVITLSNNSNGELTYSKVISTSENNTLSNLYLYIYGDDTGNGEISTSYVQSLKASISNLSAYWIKDYENSDVKAIIIPKYPSERALHISFSPFNSLVDYTSTDYTSRNILKMSVYEDDAFHNSSHAISIYGSLDNEAVNKNGTSLGFTSANSDYEEQELIYIHTFKAFNSNDTPLSQISCYPSIILDGGKRTFNKKVKETSKDSETVESYKEMSASELHNIGWQYAIDEEFPEVGVFFSSEKNMKDSKDSTFFSIASSGPQLAKFSGFIFNETPDSVTEVTEPLNYGREYWNICNIAVIDITKGSRIFSPLTGARALMQATIIENRYGGLAPMWENTNGMGGQLTTVSPYRMKYKYTKEQLAVLDSYNYNPVIMDRQYGVMVVGQRTCQAGAITDWSYIGHACAFMTCIKEIRNNVMIPQIGKANNPYYRTLRAEQVSQILRKRTEGNNRIWAEGIVDTSTADGINDAYAIKNLKFILAVHVKVDIFSEYVELNFYNEDSSSALSIN